MSPFAGGSPWAMAREIADGYFLVTDRIFGRMSRAEINKLSFEIDRCLREIRGSQTTGAEIREVQRRNRRILNLNGAQRMLRAHLLKRRG